MDHTLEIQDELEVSAELASEPTTPEEPKRRYTVTAEGGIFKNGKHYESGEIILLDAETASRFIKLGEVADE